MTARYLITFGPSCKRLVRDVAYKAGLSICSNREGLLVAANPAVQVLPVGGRGYVIGALFSRGGSEPVRSLPQAEADEAIDSSGRHLIDRYWGDYIAVLRLRAGWAVLRSPFGTLPCLYRTADECVHIASDIDTLGLAADRPWSIDYDAVARQLVFADIRGRSTCLTGVREIRGGELACFTDSAADHRTLWSPWNYVIPANAPPDAQAASDFLREQAIRCVAARTQGKGRCLVMLSGGLDSSIVAACLAAGGRDIACLNLVGPTSPGDERVYARAVAKHLKLELSERRMAQGSLLLGTLAAVRLPRPVARSFEQRLFQQAGAVAEELACGVIVDGGGGDNVFCSLQSASPAADCLLHPHSRALFWRTCSEIAQLTGASAWRVARKAAWRAWERSRPYRWPASEQMLSREAVAAALEAERHPWLSAGAPPRPGRSAQIAQLIGAQSFVEDGPHGTKSRVVSPLVSQPLVEHCLSIPPWQWIERGCNRAAARRAFAGALPSEIAWRHGKGIPDSYIMQLYEANRASIREHLLDGLLAKANVIDAAAVEAALGSPTPFKDREYSRIVRLMDTETWARGITGRP